MVQKKSNGPENQAAYLEALNDARHNLVLQARVLAFRVLPDHHNVHILMPRRQPGMVAAMNQRGVQIELLPQMHVEGAHPTSHRGEESALEAHLVPPDRLDNLRRKRGHIPVNLERLKEHRRVHGLHDLLHGAGDEGPNPVAGDQGDDPGRSVAGPGHVGD